MVYKWYILPIGGLYNPYHLLGEPETAIEMFQISESNAPSMKTGISYIYLEPILSFVLPPKEGPNSNQNKGAFGFQVYIVGIKGACFQIYRELEDQGDMSGGTVNIPSLKLTKATLRENPAKS